MDKTPILTEANIIEQFLLNFPEFVKKAKETRDEWVSKMWEKEEILSGIFFSRVLARYLMKEGLIKMNDSQLLGRLFNFMEKMALSADLNINYLLTDNVLEMIGDDKLLLARARKIMG